MPSYQSLVYRTSGSYDEETSFIVLKWEGVERGGSQVCVVAQHGGIKGQDQRPFSFERRNIIIPQLAGMGKTDHYHYYWAGRLITHVNQTTKGLSFFRWPFFL